MRRDPGLLSDYVENRLVCPGIYKWLALADRLL
jgi:hypothetical protein